MEKKVLYINACARSESRTDRIARALLERLGGLQEEVKLAECWSVSAGCRRK